MRKSFVPKSTPSLPSGASSVRLLWNICSSRTEALVVMSQLLRTVSGASVVSHDGRWCPLPESAVTAGIAWLLQVPSFSHECPHGACYEVLSPLCQLRASPDIIFSSNSVPHVVVILTFLLRVSYYRPGTETKVLPRSQEVVQFSYLCCSVLAFISSTDNAYA